MTLKQETGDDLECINVDLMNWNETKQALRNVGSLDGLVNNAGIAVIKPFSEITEDDFDRQMGVNIKAVFNVCQVIVPQMRDGGSIVNVSSLASSRAFQDHSAYSISKAGVDMLTKSLALELGTLGRSIRVNSVNPTVILTKMGRENWSEPSKAKPLLDKIPMKRFGEVSEVIEPIVYLLSDKSSFINGTHMLIEGGYSVQ